MAGVILETIPATYGFPMPAPGYLPAVKALCEQYGTLYIADEVQTGLMRCGEMWGWQSFGVEPDIFVAAKGLSGGLYPIAACMLGERAGGWLHEDGAAHISTTGGGEVGCFVALKVLRDPRAPGDARERAGGLGVLRRGLRRADAGGIRTCIVGLRQRGTVMGVEFDHPEGAVAASRGLYENGVWAIFSSLDKRVLQFKPGVLMSRALCEEVLRAVRGGDAAHPRADRGARAGLSGDGADRSGAGGGRGGAARSIRWARRPPRRRGWSTCRRTRPSAIDGAADGSRYALRIHREGYHSARGDRLGARLGAGAARGRASCRRRTRVPGGTAS